MRSSLESSLSKRLLAYERYVNGEFKRKYGRARLFLWFASVISFAAGISVKRYALDEDVQYVTHSNWVFASYILIGLATASICAFVYLNLSDSAIGDWFRNKKEKNEQPPASNTGGGV